MPAHFGAAEGKPVAGHVPGPSPQHPLHHDKEQGSHSGESMHSLGVLHTINRDWNQEELFEADLITVSTVEPLIGN